MYQNYSIEWFGYVLTNKKPVHPDGQIDDKVVSLMISGAPFSLTSLSLFPVIRFSDFRMDALQDWGIT